MTRTKPPKVVLFGLDCLAPELLFDRWLAELPNFRSLVTTGSWGRLRSVDPPITVPAWSCMMSGFDAGQIGIYGFRHRVIGSYEDRYLALGDRVHVPRVWDHLSQAGLTSGLVGVPDTYPPRKLNGYSVGGFLAPSTAVPYTYPDSLKDEIVDVIGDYRLDVDNFRSEERARILMEIYQMTDQRFDLFRHLLRTNSADFMMLVEIGPDRIQHAFWRFSDPNHRLYQHGHPYEHAIRDYYRHLDVQLGRTLELIDPSTHIYVVSDHGARTMEGAFCVNDWLIARGYLRLRQLPSRVTAFDESLVDWSRTRAWAWGGYYGRVFVNLEGREAVGQVPRAEYESFLSELSRELENIGGPDGMPLGNRVLRPRDVTGIGAPRGDYPDLLVYFGDLSWRAAGSVGNSELFRFDNDTWPDDANHDSEGVFICRGPDPGAGYRTGLRLVDVGPTLLEQFGLASPPEAIGKAIELGDPVRK